MKEGITNLQPADITSDVFVIAPSQLDYIANVFGRAFAETMNMKTFTNRICQVAKDSLRTALKSAKKMGEDKNITH